MIFGKALIFVVLFTVLAFVSVGSATETPPDEAWNKTFGGTHFDKAYAVQQTADGGYILVGYTRLGFGNNDFWLVKSDSNGGELWSRTFGGDSVDDAHAVQQTTDGGYIIAGCTYSYDTSTYDARLAKIGSNGDYQWERIFGRKTSDDFVYSVQQTADSGYILAGYTTSYGVGKSDFWLVKTDSSGNMQWDQSFGGNSFDEAREVQQTSDGGYILVGYTKSYGAGDNDFWLVKTDSNGAEEWNRTFGGTECDDAWAVLQIANGGYILAGYTGSYGASSWDAWLVKTDSNGADVWNRTFGGACQDGAYSVQQTADGGYILAGYTESYGAGWRDVLLVKANSNGDEEWNKTVGGTSDDEAYSVQQTADGGYILAGYTYSFGAGSSDFWLIKVKGKSTKTIFDTEPSENPYPSIRGTHTGTIKPSADINVSKLYTYACAGTGGHTEYIKLYDNSTLIANGTWNGYLDEDWHNITLHNGTDSTSYVTLLQDHEYNYTIRTGSYPQILHATSKEVTGGTITCSSFVDTNGNIYTDWIPAIKFS
jgi:hypothetical protein